MSKKGKVIGIVFLFTFFLFLFVLFMLNKNNDGMDNDGIMNVYYKTYIKEKGWTNWSKNGITSGSLVENNPIVNVKFKTGIWNEDELSFSLYTNKNKKWTPIDRDELKKNIRFQGVRIGGTKGITNKYNIYYRTYNSNNKWMNWSCNNSINGNSKYDILGIQVKVIPKNVILNEYLKDYSENKNFSVENF